MTDDVRRMTPEVVDTYWRAGHRVVAPVPGSPTCQVVFDPSYGTISLKTPLTGAEPAVAALRNVSLYTETDGEVVWAEIRVAVSGSHQAAFSLVTDIADRLQVRGEALAVAAPRAIAEYRDLLARRSSLTDEQQRGLYGELLVIEHLAGTLGAEAALAAWHGPDAEEHDFFLPTMHLEVKTTTSERRRHAIGSSTQLAASAGIPLWLVSVQITRSAAAVGRTLPQLVAASRRAMKEHSVGFDLLLDALQWRDQDADLYPDVWALRSAPRAYEVRDDFPRITDELIDDRVPSRALVSDVSYRIDVSSFPYPHTPASLSGFTEIEAQA